MYSNVKKIDPHGLVLAMIACWFEDKKGEKWKTIN